MACPTRKQKWQIVYITCQLHTLPDAARYKRVEISEEFKSRIDNSLFFLFVQFTGHIMLVINLCFSCHVSLTSPIHHIVEVLWRGAVSGPTSLHSIERASSETLPNVFQIIPNTSQQQMVLLFHISFPTLIIFWVLWAKLYIWINSTQLSSAPLIYILYRGVPRSVLSNLVQNLCLVLWDCYLVFLCFCSSLLNSPDPL